MGRGELMHMVMTGVVAGRSDGAALAQACDDASMAAAVNKSFKAAVGTTTSVVTEAIARDQGFLQVKRVSFADFEHNGGKPFQTTVPAPNTHATLWYGLLSKVSEAPGYKIEQPQRDVA